MIDLVFKFLRDELNTYFLTQTGTNTVEITVSQLVDEMGKYAFDQEQIAAVLLNIEEERIFKSQQLEHTYTNGQHVVLEPELKLNLYIMFAAYFKQYEESLKFLSYILTFFQSHRSFTADRYPALDPRILKLNLELESPTYEHLNQIWTFLGAKHLPSVIYKVRLVVLQDQTQVAIQPPIAEVKTESYYQ
jgi:hypothetical protein